jgi:hypothetical protein
MRWRRKKRPCPSFQDQLMEVESLKRRVEEAAKDWFLCIDKRRVWENGTFDNPGCSVEVSRKAAHLAYLRGCESRAETRYHKAANALSEAEA